MPADAHPQAATVGMRLRGTVPNSGPDPFEAPAVPADARGDALTRTAAWTCGYTGHVSNTALPGWCVYCARPMAVPAPGPGWHDRRRMVVRAGLRRHIRRVRRMTRERTT